MKTTDPIDGKLFLYSLIRDYEHKLPATLPHLKDVPKQDFEALGNALYYLFNMSTCQYGCDKGNHLIEGFSAKLYNSAVGSFYMMLLGFYDESLNLVRSMGELNNLVFLFITDYPNCVNEWASMDEANRRRNFSPVKVRLRVEDLGHLDMIPMDENEYSELSGYSHINGSTLPNSHDNPKQSTVGGLPQLNGTLKTFETLTLQTLMAALLVARALNHRQIVKHVETLIKKTPH
jgi:hypothetical protein